MTTSKIQEIVERLLAEGIDAEVIPIEDVEAVGMSEQQREAVAFALKLFNEVHLNPTYISDVGEHELKITVSKFHKLKAINYKYDPAIPTKCFTCGKNFVEQTMPGNWGCPDGHPHWFCGNCGVFRKGNLIQADNGTCASWGGYRCKKYTPNPPGSCTCTQCKGVKKP